MRPHQPPRSTAVVIGLLLLFAAVIGLGSVRRPYGEILSEQELSPPSSVPIAANGFRVASFNIHSGRDGKGEENLTRTARVMEGFDLVGMNEVRGPSLLRSRNQAEQLGIKLGMAAIFGPSERRWYLASFGNGMLSRYPILSWRSRPMRVAGESSYRAVIFARVAMSTAAATVIVVHVERGQMGDFQLREVSDLFAQVRAPALLMGDFNADAAHPELLRISKLPGVTDALRARSGDRIYVKGFVVSDSGMIANEASDHPLVWAELKYSVAQAKKVDLDSHWSGSTTAGWGGGG